MQLVTIPWALYLVYVTNLWYALPKKSLSVALPFMKQGGLPITTVEIGAFSAAFSLGYGCFKFIGGVLVDWFGREEKHSGVEGRAANVLFVLGLLAGSLVNLFVPALAALFANRPNNNGLLLFCIQVSWFINGAMQGVGGPALSKLVIQSLPAARRSEVWATLHSANNLGYLFAPYLLLLPIHSFGWQGPFFVAGGIGVIVCVLGLLCPLVNSKRGTVDDSAVSAQPTINDSNQSYPLSGTDITRRVVKTSALVLANAVTYFVIKTMSDWTTPFLMEARGLTSQDTVNVSFWIEIGAIVGGYTVGVAMRARLLESKEVLCGLYCVVTLIFLFILRYVEMYAMAMAPWQWSLLYFGAGFGVNAPKAVLFLLATEEWLELVHVLRGQVSARSVLYCLVNMGAGALSGIIGLFAQLGASMSGYLMGVRILPFRGWTALCAVQVVSMSVLISLLIVAYLSNYIQHVKVE